MTQASSRTEFPINCQLVDRETGKTVQGQIAPSRKRDLLLWTQWRYRAEDDDKSWDWWGILLESRRTEYRYECYSLIAEGKLEGLMALDLKVRKTASGHGIIVDYLATSPNNRMKDRGLKHVGLALLFLAIQRSIECGSKGAIWLESLPGAERFYLSLGMMRQTAKSSEGNTIYILEANAAKQLLEEIRFREIIKA